MHLLILLAALTVSVGLRLSLTSVTGGFEARWRRSLSCFLVPPLLLLTTGIALVWMGPQGQMVRWWEGWSSYALAIGFLVFAAVLACQLTVAGWRSLRQIRTYPELALNGESSRLLPTSTPFIAQVGFWTPQLVVSQGLLDMLDSAHLTAVLTHEHAHAHYRDTFWFFCLGWLRRITAWLPQTDALWQDLLVLRELRADRWAVQQVDSLLLAESLVHMVSLPDLYPDLSAAFSSEAPQNRLQERVEALLSEPEVLQRSSLWSWSWVLFVLLPLMTVPFHH